MGIRIPNVLSRRNFAKLAYGAALKYNRITEVEIPVVLPKFCQAVVNRRFILSKFLALPTTGPGFAKFGFKDPDVRLAVTLVYLRPIY